MIEATKVPNLPNNDPVKEPSRSRMWLHWVAAGAVAEFEAKAGKRRDNVDFVRAEVESIYGVSKWMCVPLRGLIHRLLPVD